MKESSGASRALPPRSAAVSEPSDEDLEQRILEAKRMLAERRRAKAPAKGLATVIDIGRGRGRK